VLIVLLDGGYVEIVVFGGAGQVQPSLGSGSIQKTWMNGDR
jgi:hypothetical protein